MHIRCEYTYPQKLNSSKPSRYKYYGIWASGYNRIIIKFGSPNAISGMEVSAPVRIMISRIQKSVKHNIIITPTIMAVIK